MTNKKATPEKETVPKEQSNEKLQAFLNDYKTLVDKHKVDFTNYPMYVPDGQGGFRTIIQTTPIDISDRPVKSDFVPK